MNKQTENGQALRLSSGQAMVEAMVALSVIIVGVLGVFTLTSRSLSLNKVDADKYVAVNLANEGVELVKNLLDKNIMDDTEPWNYLPCDGSGSACPPDSNPRLYEMGYDDSYVTPLASESAARPLFFSAKGNGYYRYDQQTGDAPTNFKRKIVCMVIHPCIDLSY